MIEDHILNLVDLEHALAKLERPYREMILIIYRVWQPDDWEGRWPPTYQDIGVYIGIKFEGKPLSEAAIRYRRDQVKEMWKGKRGKLRRTRRTAREQE
jgi:hypothetical protein